MRNGAAVAGLLGVTATMAAAPCAAQADRGDPAVVAAALEEALRHEQREAAAYARVLRDHGQVAPFATIAEAERSHAEMVAGLFERRGLPLPPDRSDAGRAPAYRTVAEACAAAARMEEENVAMYDRLLDAEIPGYVRHVFRHNRNVSKYEHLPAFRRCSGAGPAVREIPGDPAPAGTDTARRRRSPLQRLFRRP